MPIPTPEPPVSTFRQQCPRCLAEADHSPDEKVCSDNVIGRLRAELQQWERWNIVEIAVRNRQVSEYMDHWEGRATKAEALLVQRAQEIADLKHELALNATMLARQCDLAREAETLTRAYEEREAAVCPEDVGFDEYIRELTAHLTARAQEIEQVKAERKEAVQKIGRAMWAFMDHLKRFQHPYWWPDSVKDAFSDAVIDRRPLSNEDIQRTLELAERFGWEKTK